VARKDVTAKRLTDKQYDILVNLPEGSLYSTKGSLTEKWYVYFHQVDKYFGGFDTKEEADEAIRSGACKDREAGWLTGNAANIYKRGGLTK